MGCYGTGIQDEQSGRGRKKHDGCESEERKNECYQLELQMDGMKLMDWDAAKEKDG